MRALYEEHCIRPSDIFEHLPTFVALCEQLDAKNVIELGVRGGVSTVAWLYGLEQTDGHLHSVDISAPPEIESDRWTFTRGNDVDPDLVSALPASVDIVFIDTSHTYEQTLQELALYVPKVRSGGVVVLHDTEVEHPDLTEDYNFPVKRAVELFTMANGLSWTNEPKCNGLGTIEVR